MEAREATKEYLEEDSSVRKVLEEFSKECAIRDFIFQDQARSPDSLIRVFSRYSRLRFFFGFPCDLWPIACGLCCGLCCRRPAVAGNLDSSRAGHPAEARGRINFLNQSFLAEFAQQAFDISRADAQSYRLELAHHLLRGKRIWTSGRSLGIAQQTQAGFA